MAGQSPGQISHDLDLLSCELIGEALDVLADTPDMGTVATVLDPSGMRLTCAFEDDSPDECLEGARQWVRGLASGSVAEPGFSRPVCYAIAYPGAVDLGDGYGDALMVEFGDRGNVTDYSAFLVLEGVGSQDGLRWTDPAPAGELEPLL